MKTKSHSQSLRLRLLFYFSIIISVMFAFVVFSIDQTNTYNAMSQETLLRAAKLQEVVQDVDTMITTLKVFLNSGNQDFVLEYEYAYKNAIIMCAELKNENPLSYVYRDIYEILRSIYQDGKKIIDRYSVGEEAFYLRGNVPSVERLQAFLEEVVFLGINEDLAQFDLYSKRVTAQTRNYTQIIYVLCVFVTLLCILFAFHFSKSIADPIHSLSRSCLRVQEGDLTTRSPHKTGTEIDILVKAFNEMVHALEVSKQNDQQKVHMENMLKEEQIAIEKMRAMLFETELKFLRMQINPHFLFNTFNTISAMSQIEGAEITYDLIGRLSSILHYAMKGVGQRVTLGDEIQVTHDYLEIQKMRFQDRLRYSIDIPQEILAVRVDAMLLQPIVENAILHGLEPRAEGGSVCISGCVETDKLIITITDNGVGFDHKNTEFSEFSKKGHGIGLNNLLRRLDMLQGENTLEVKSDKDIGTTVTLILEIEKIT